MNWTELVLGEAIHVKHGFAFKGEYFATDGQFMVLTPGNFLEKGGFRVRLGKERFYTSDFPQSYLLAKGDLIIAMTEQGEGLLGSAARVPEDERYLHNQRLGLVSITQPSRLNKNFLYWAFNSAFVRAQIRGSSTGAKVKHTAPERIYKVKINVPDLDHQGRIAAVLDAYNDLIETNRRRIALLEESARLLYREWFVNLSFPGYERVRRVNGLPEGWRQVTLGDLATLNYGKALKESDRKHGDVSVYGSSGIVGTHDKALVAGPALIVGRKGNVGSVFFSRKGCFPIDTVYFVEGEQVTYYLYLLLQTMNFISSDSAVPGLNRNYAYSLPVLRPGDAVLTEFENAVDPIFMQIDTLVETNKKAAAARDDLLPKLMSGEIRV